MNAVGNRTAKTQDGVSESYSFDNIDQVSGVSYSGTATTARTVAYNYDATGNRTSVVDNGVSTAYQPIRLNAYTSVGGAALSNDSNGNLTNGGTIQSGLFFYDAQNRLTRAVVSGNTTDFYYDSKNRVVKRSLNNVPTFLIYDGWNLIDERNSAGTQQARYVHGTNTDERPSEGYLNLARGVNCMAQGSTGAQILTKGDSTGVVYYHHDGLGSVTQITDNLGTRIERYLYDIFGAESQKVEMRRSLQRSEVARCNPTKSGDEEVNMDLEIDEKCQNIKEELRVKNSSGIVTMLALSGAVITTSSRGNRFFFTGRERIQAAGLYDYRNRVYSENLGRFLQTDPIRFEAGDVNVYRYCGNRPHRFRDPMGLCHSPGPRGEAGDDGEDTGGDPAPSPTPDPKPDTPDPTPPKNDKPYDPTNPDDPNHPDHNWQGNESSRPDTDEGNPKNSAPYDDGTHGMTDRQAEGLMDMFDAATSQIPGVGEAKDLGQFIGGAAKAAGF